MSWSRHGYENASYCISHTGRHPAMHSPTAAPRIPASARGVSTQRSLPKRSRRPAVARKTPPARPTSSPMTSTSSSRSSSTWNASLIASTMDSSAIAQDPPQLRQIGSERGRRIDERMLEELRRVGRRLRLGGSDSLAQQLSRPDLDLVRRRIVQHAEPAQVAVVPTDALALLLLLDALEIDVRLRVVGGRVRANPIRHRLDERRPSAGACALDGLARRLVDSEDIGAVDTKTRDAVPDALVGERVGRGLRAERRRDRPLVVVAEED